MALLPGSRSPCPAVQSPLCALPGGLNPTPALSRSRADQQEPRCHNERLSTRRLCPVPVTAGSSRLPNGPVHRRTNQGSTWPLWTNQRRLRLLCGATVRKGGKRCERRAVEGRAGGSSSDSFQPLPRRRGRHFTSFTAYLGSPGEFTQLNVTPMPLHNESGLPCRLTALLVWGFTAPVPSWRDPSRFAHTRCGRMMSLD